MRSLILLLTLAAPAAAQDLLPVYDKDPWWGFGEGTWVRFKTVHGENAEEHTLKVAEAGKDGKKLRMDEGDPFPYLFTPISETLGKPDGGLKRTGKGEQTIQIGSRSVKAKMEEFSFKDAIGPAPVRILTASELPGGVVRFKLLLESAEEQLSLEYEFKALEKVKVGDRTVETARYDFKMQKKSESLKVEGRIWLSSAVPDLRVRTEIKTTRGKTVETDSFQILEFGR